MSLQWYGVEVKNHTLDAVRRGMDRTMADCVVVAKDLAPRKTAALQGSIQMRPTVEQGSALVGYWGSFGIDYAIYQEMGTGVYAGGEPYEIRPRRRKALWWPGLDHPVTSVMHPGIHARPYLRPAADACYPGLQDNIRMEYAA